MKSGDVDVIDHMLQYCDRVQQSVERFGDDLNKFLSDYDYQQSVCLSIFQIGEFVVHLSNEYMIQTKSLMNWRGMKDLRNIIGHNYGNVDFNTIWRITKDDIPKIKAFCEHEIAIWEQHQDLEEEMEIGLNMDLTL